MTDHIAAPAAADTDRFVTFTYRGWHFLCRAERENVDTYRPSVVCRGKGAGDEEFALPPDTDNVAYASEPEALRHAEQQAMRWVHDRSADTEAKY